jgi:outer membrane immunogenic protein
MPLKAPVLKAPAPTSYSWTGIFGGGSVGGQSWDISGIYALPPPDAHNTSGSGGVFGGHVGAQYQINSWVLGVEAAYNSPFSNSFSTSASPSPDCLGATPIASRICSSRIDHTWTVGGRLGYAAGDRILLYGSGGFANGQVDTRTSVATTGVLTSSTSVNQSGWYAGAGAEYFVTKFLWSDLILGAEYQHIDLGTARHVDTITGLPADTRNVKATEDVARARVIFKWAP